MKIHSVKMNVGKFRIPVSIEDTGERLVFNFPYNKILIEEIKQLEGRKYHGFDETNPRKVWSAKKSPRNIFQIAFLCGHNPYAPYDTPIEPASAFREKLHTHQREMKALMFARRKCIIAGEMGTGKTLAAIEGMEASGYIDWLWVGPKGTLAEIELQFEMWEAKIEPIFLSYDKFRCFVQEGSISPADGIIFDEAAKLKNPTSQRSQCARAFVEAMVKINNDARVVLMSGAAAPRDPADWWHLCEIVCPGFLREGDIHKFRRRLALVEQTQSLTGNTFPKFITWWDNPNKCATCGSLKLTHSGRDHNFESSKDEIKILYQRMQGLVGVWMKKDCLDLPDKIYRKINLKPAQDVLRAANLIKQTAPRTVTAMMQLRELSDGFQYVDKKDGLKPCDRCSGTKTASESYDPDNPDDYPSQEAVESGRCLVRKVTCPRCNGSGQIDKINRSITEIPTPKIDLFKDLLDEFEGVGRLVTYAGFQGSIDRLVRTANTCGWDVVKADGRGWAYYRYIDKGVSMPMTQKDLLKLFQTGYEKQVVFIGGAGAAGSGLTLTASPAIFFYSNPFDAEARIQAEDRIHRIGMDNQRGATIIDCVHLAIDQYILDNLEKKRDMLKTTMGNFKDAYDEIDTNIRKY